MSFIGRARLSYPILQGASYTLTRKATTQIWQFFDFSPASTSRKYRFPAFPDAPSRREPEPQPLPT